MMNNFKQPLNCGKHRPVINPKLHTGVTYWFHHPPDIEMSRLIIKNLPAYISDARIRDHFSQKGTVTDARLAQKGDGTSRRFAFVGYKTETEARAAKEYFDRTYIDASRIQVEIVNNNPESDPSSSRPTKRPRLTGPSDTSSKHHSKNATTPTAPYLERKVPETSSGAKDKNKKKTKEKLEAEFMQTMLTKKSKAPNALDIGEVDAKDGPKPHPKQPKVPADQQPGQETDDSISDLEWMRRKMRDSGVLENNDETPGTIFHQSDDEKEVGEGTVEEKENFSDQPMLSTEQAAARDLILSTGRLFLRNLSFTCAEADLQESFGTFGELAQVHIPLDPQSKKPKGLAFVTYKLPSHALAAYEAMDRRDFQGRLVHILPALERRPIEDKKGERKTLKDGAKEKKKSEAGKEFNWSMLYMNSDAVISSIADRLKISKADILNPESDNAAVKLALAETHVIQETKKYLEDEGIMLDAFSGSRVHRSNTTILIKNIPYGTTQSDLTDLFDKHGDISRLLLPPAGTMAVVEFHHPADAKSAFKGVAYKRLGSSIIYLEWAPEGVWDENKKGKAHDGGEGANASHNREEKVNDDLLNPAGGLDLASQESALPAGSTLFIKNLNFSTTTERLVQAFRGLAGFAFARVQTKPDPNNRPSSVGSEGRLSMGYGFIGFRTVEYAKNALKTVNGYALDRHTLVASFAGRGAEEDPKTDDGKLGGKTKTTKMIVKNVPFEATKKDIRELFGAHGSLKSVRLPRKFDHKTRGFAFLEFKSRHEAENAMVALKHTHLLGRHLVLDWAEEGSGVDVDELREKIKRGYVEEGKEVAGKKRKIDIDAEGGFGGEGVDDV